ncbi:1851_t:CDS:2 [Paraglomus brasilianum]|uniref:1851_t:CDS:1 n=1 Tax=Paraglomus brasilianum TaxID=144538 RepID=A0A9N9F755_9GLOM|nr:1851_t:CDS:2 [Paraglomus brasilianum]
MILETLSLFSFWNAVNVFCIISILYVVNFYFLYFIRQNPLPGPFPLPLVGNLFQLLLFAGDIGKWGLHCQEKYGDIWETYVGNAKIIWLARADLAEKLMSPSRDSNYFHRTWENCGFNELGFSASGIIFNRNKTTWAFNRKMFAQAITSSKFTTPAIEWVQTMFVEMEGYLLGLGYDEKEFNFADWIPRLFTDMLFAMTMDKYACTLATLYNSHNPPKLAPYPEEAVAESDIFVKSMRKQFHALKYFRFTPEIIRNKTPFGRKKTKDYLDNLVWLRGVLINIIREKREKIMNTDEALRPDLMTLLAAVNTSKDMTQKSESIVEPPLTDEEIGNCFIDITSGGIDTSSNLICSIIYCIVKHPEVKKRLRFELDTVLGTDPVRIISHEDLNKLEYTEAVIQEVSRLHPVTPFVSRLPDKDDVIGGYPIKGGELLFVSVSGIQLHPKHWHNPKEFNPDRFLERDRSSIKCEFPMFGGGLRLCPGRQLAMTEMKIIIAMIFRKYDPELATPDTTPKYKYEGINRCYELMLRFKKRID